MSGFLDWLAAVFAAIIPGLGGPEAPGFNGYVEAEYVYMAAAAAGRITEMRFAEGSSVAAGDILFRIDDAHQVAAVRAAEAEVAVAQANLENLSTGSREEEINVIRASVAQARADQRLAQSTLARSEQLKATGAVSQAKVDQDRTAYASATARVAQLEAELQVAELPARDAQRIAAEASHQAALAQLDDARTALADREVETPVAGVVDKLFFLEGEVAGAGSPVVSVLPLDTLKALFFVPEPDRAGIAIGQVFDVACNGCPDGVTATITRLADTPQFTPPIIYSREESGRLVFRAEARLDDAGGLLPGQPVRLTPRP